MMTRNQRLVALCALMAWLAAPQMTQAKKVDCWDACFSQFSNCTDSCDGGGPTCGHWGVCIDYGHVCGDSQCNAEEGENETNCAYDCGGL
jgi:hypothetical protein